MQLRLRLSIQLVSSSVPGLNEANVTIVDQFGKLLSNPIDDPRSILSNSQLQHRVRLENIYRSRVVSIVTPIVGAGNVSAQINLELDFTLSEETEEIVDPEQSVLRSEQNTLDTTTDGKAKGIPGALSNTPPMAAELKSSPEAATAGENVLSSYLQAMLETMKLVEKFLLRKTLQVELQKFKLQF